MPYRARQGRQVAIGTALVAALTVVALLIFFLSNLLRLARDTYHLIAVFEQAPRLRVGSQVWIGGYPVGHVARIEFLRPDAGRAGRLALVLEIPTRFRSFVRRDSYVRVTSYRLLGDPVVDVVPGSPDQPPLRPGDTLRARPRITLDHLLVKGRVVRAALDSLRVSTAALDALVRAREPSLARADAAFDAARAEYDRLAAQFDEGALADFLRDPSWQATLDHLEASTERILQALREAPGRASGASADASLEQLARHAERLSQQIDRLEALLAEPRGFLGRMAQDTALAAALHRARAQLDSLVAETRQAPLRFFF